MIYTVTLNPGIDKEYSVPEIRENQVLRASSVKTDIGGKGFNVSRMLINLGCTSTAMGFIGGYTGELLRKGLENLGIVTDLVEIEAESRTNISIVDAQNKKYIKVNEPGPLIKSSEIERLITKVMQSVKPGDWWIFSGSLPQSVPDEFFAQMITMISEKGANTVLDSSGIPFRLGCQASPFLIKPNLTEAILMSGKKADNLQQSIDMIPFIHNIGPQNVVISAGEEGALLSNGAEIWIGKPPVILERNPVGAGDAMLAGIVYSLTCSQPLPQAFKFGLACGSAAASLPGTAMPDQDGVADLLNQVVINPLS